MVLHVSRLAKRDLLSYIMIFLIIVFGFGVGGCMIYGDKLDGFKYVLTGSLEIILMTVGGVDYQEMKSIEPVVTPIFVFTYFIAAYIIFLKMFIVILDATFKEFSNYVEKEDITLMAYVSSLLKGLIKKIDLYIKGKTIDEIREKYRGNKGLMTRLKLYFEIFYDRVVKQIQEKLWLVIKALILVDQRDWRLTTASDQNQMHNLYQMYRSLRTTKPSKKVTFESSERFSHLNGLKRFLSQYHSGEGVKASKVGGDRAEDSSTNEWFNNLNDYIHQSTNGNYSLKKTNHTLNNDKKVIFMSVLELSTIISFRENELIDKKMEIKNLAFVISARIKNHVQSIKLEKQKFLGKGKKEKDSREKYTKKLIEKSKLVTEISTSGYNFEVENELQQSAVKASSEPQAGSSNIEFRLITNFLVLMLY